MTIQGIGPIDPISKYKKTGKTKQAPKTEKTDSIDVSAEAKAKAEMYKATETVKNSPEIRHQKIEEIKKKIEDPNYISDKVIDMIADKILESFDI